MRTISLWQPWATLVAIGAKRFETRSWRSDHFGPVAIHATKGFGKLGDGRPFTVDDCAALCASEPFRSALAAAGIGGVDDLPFGKVLAVGIVAASIRIPHAPARFAPVPGRSWQWEPAAGHYNLSPGRVEQVPPPDPERSFGDYTPGRFAWLLSDVTRLREPVKAQGGRKFWTWDDAEAADAIVGLDVAPRIRQAIEAGIAEGTPATKTAKRATATPPRPPPGQPRAGAQLRLFAPTPARKAVWRG